MSESVLSDKVVVPINQIGRIVHKMQGLEYNRYQFPLPPTLAPRLMSPLHNRPPTSCSPKLYQ